MATKAWLIGPVTVLVPSTVKDPPQYDSIQKVHRRQNCASYWREFGSWIAIVRIGLKFTMLPHVVQ